MVMAPVLAPVMYEAIRHIQAMQCKWNGKRGMILYHVTTEKKARLYREHGSIISPVRGFTTIMAALAWACKVGRRVIYCIDTDALDADVKCYKLPDHHNKYGEAWWVDGNVDCEKIKCVFSAEKDA